MGKITREQRKTKGKEIVIAEPKIRHIKIPKDGICCPFCKSKESHTVVPMNCCMPTIEICENCGKDFIIEGDDILYIV
jgi:hypothetical protein